MGCDIHRGINFAGEPIGGECCKAKDTFQLCTGDVTNTTTLKCTNATSHSLSDGKVTLEWSTAALVGAPTSVRCKNLYDALRLVLLLSAKVI